MRAMADDGGRSSRSPWWSPAVVVMSRAAEGRRVSWRPGSGRAITGREAGEAGPMRARRGKCSFVRIIDWGGGAAICHGSPRPALAGPSAGRLRSVYESCRTASLFPRFSSLHVVCTDTPAARRPIWPCTCPPRGTPVAIVSTGRYLSQPAQRKSFPILAMHWPLVLALAHSTWPKRSHLFHRCSCSAKLASRRKR